MFKRFINWLFRGNTRIQGIRDGEITVSDMENIRDLVVENDVIKIGNRALLRYDKELDVIIVDGDIGSDMGCVNTRVVVNGDVEGSLVVSNSSVSINGNVGSFKRAN